MANAEPPIWPQLIGMIDLQRPNERKKKCEAKIYLFHDQNLSHGKIHIIPSNVTDRNDFPPKVGHFRSENRTSCICKLLVVPSRYRLCMYHQFTTLVQYTPLGLKSRYVGIRGYQLCINYHLSLCTYANCPSGIEYPGDRSGSFSPTTALYIYIFYHHIITILRFFFFSSASELKFPTNWPICR